MNKLIQFLLLTGRCYDERQARLAIEQITCEIIEALEDGEHEEAEDLALSFMGSSMYVHLLWNAIV